MIRYEDDYDAEPDPDRRRAINPFDVGGRTALGPRGGMFRLGRWMRDSEIWADEDDVNVKGVNKKCGSSGEILVRISVLTICASSRSTGSSEVPRSATVTNPTHPSTGPSTSAAGVPKQPA